MKKERRGHSQVNIKKAPDRIEVLKKIEALEREGKFDLDVEDDPPTIPLESGEVDYLRKKISSKMKVRTANTVALTMYDSLVKENKLIIKKVNGIENLVSLKKGCGAIVTCNHFNPFDSFVIEKTFRLNKKYTGQKIYKVIREGNYTNFPGLYGFLMRNCNTLPLSRNKSVMIEFVKAVETILKKGHYILIFPEESMWWNYRKPKPLKQGAFIFAARNNVPVIPTFITMRDTDKLAKDGSIIQAYTLHFLPAIYPEERLSQQENVANMKKENERLCKEVYEKVYGEPLTYLTEAK